MPSQVRPEVRCLTVNFHAARVVADVTFLSRSAVGVDGSSVYPQGAVGACAGESLDSFGLGWGRGVHHVAA